MTGQENIRIAKVLKEFNIGMGTLVDFLKKKGIEVEHNPSSKISSDAYSLVQKEFGNEQIIKELSKKVALTVKDITESESSHNANKEEENVEEVLIKNVSPKGITHQPAPTKAKEEVYVPEEIHIKNEIKVIGKIDLEKPTHKPISTPTPAAEPPREPIKSTPEPTPKPVPEHVLETIPEQIKTPVPEPAKIFTTTDKKETNQVKIVSEKPNIAKEEKGENIPEKQVIEHIDTVFPKFAGPKISGTMDLSQFDRKPSSKNDKNKGKRERIHKQKVDVNSEQKKTDNPNNNRRGGAPNNQNNNNNRNSNNNSNRNSNNNNRNTTNQNNNQQGGKRNRKDRFKPVHTEIAEDEVQKQIKDTYARMTENKGKTKGAKHRKEKRELFSQKMQEEIEMQELTNNVLKVTEFVTVNELAIMMNSPVTKVIEACMNLGLMVSINQRLDAEALVLVAEEFGYKIEFTTAEIDSAIPEEPDQEEDLLPRPPVITVMGHVDHGKTSLLDQIRNSNVIAGEAGGITQHIGAYNVKLSTGKRITFLDTPGHEAFTAMRARGAKLTDLAIIIVAADDAIMPQTIEAINHAQAAGVHMVFAINKIDKQGANPDRIREQLANMNILVEDWGGKYQCQEISAKKGVNIDKLLEKVLLETDLLELKANPNKRAVGTVIESSLDKGRGYLATILVQNGTLHTGDIMLCGSYTGRVKAMFNERGQKIEEAGPSTPVSVLGLNGAPTAGETFNILEDEKEAKDLANKREQLIRIQGLRTQKHITLEEIGRRIAIGNFQELNIIVKGDVDGSIEALSDSLIKLSTEEIHVNVIHKAVGAISETDILLAAASNAIVIGFQVRPSASARKLAEKEEIEIRLYSIIYDAINEVKSGIEGMLAPEEKEEVTSSAEVREIYKINKVGTVAGCMVKEGKLTRSNKVRVIRDGIVIYEGLLGSLKRFKDDVKEVQSGFDCGLNVEGYNDIKVGDIIEAYTIIQVKRKL